MKSLLLGSQVSLLFREIIWMGRRGFQLICSIMSNQKLYSHIGKVIPPQTPKRNLIKERSPPKNKISGKKGVPAYLFNHVQSEII